MRCITCLALAATTLIRCSDDGIIHEEEIDLQQCTIPATVRNFSGLDGCGYVLELTDGTILEPLRLVLCSPPPESVMTLHDPLFDFQEDNAKVLIDYEDYEGVSACMTGKLVRVSCIAADTPATLKTSF